MSEGNSQCRPAIRDVAARRRGGPSALTPATLAPVRSARGLPRRARPRGCRARRRAADANVVAAVDRTCGQSRPGGPPAARLPQGHRRVRRHRRDDRISLRARCLRVVAIQLSYAALTRIASRRNLLAAGGFLFGGGFAAQAVTT